MIFALRTADKDPTIQRSFSVMALKSSSKPRRSYVSGLGEQGGITAVSLSGYGYHPKFICTTSAATRSFNNKTARINMICEREIYLTGPFINRPIENKDGISLNPSHSFYKLLA